MGSEMQTAPFPKRLEHLQKLISSPRFLQKEGLGNEVPFFIIPFKPSETYEINKLRAQLTNRLLKQGIEILEINLYDLCHDLLVQEGDWDYWMANEKNEPKEILREELQGALDVERILIPAMAERMADTNFDVMFISGVGEVFPFIRSHNVLNNLQKEAKEKPTVMFFPGEYTHSLANGASLDLFAPIKRLEDDKYYRAFNIFDREI
eukprot:COSAG01_NODE_5193_length_4419_cov_606.935591_2_plen_207_part_00